ncbi:hypothetical protein FS749_015568 [Ceratobasidium sp. UAMH 11750]|nr:hypothetical protein FS749_015568 [Ceratobasidium sp. UAMH 11750]
MDPTQNSSEGSFEPEIPPRLTKLARRLKKLIAIDRKGLGACLEDVLEVFYEISQPSSELVDAVTAFVDKVGRSSGKYVPDEHPEFGDYVQSVAVACLDFLQGHYSDNTSQLVCELAMAKEQLQEDRKQKSQFARNQRKQRKHEERAQEVTRLLQKPENAYVFDVKTRQRIRLKAKDLQALQDSLGGAIRSRKCKATTAETGSTAEDVLPTTAEDSAEGGIPAELADYPFHPSIPETDVPNILQDCFVDDEDLDRERFQIFRFGFVYGLKRAPDGTYRLIFAAAFLDLGAFSIHELARIQCRDLF